MFMHIKYEINIALTKKNRGKANLCIKNQLPSFQIRFPQFHPAVICVS